MDYSLLVGIHDLGRGNRDDLRNRGLSMFEVWPVLTMAWRNRWSAPTHALNMLVGTGGGTAITQPKTLTSKAMTDVVTKSQRKAIRKAISQSDPVALRDASQGLPNELPEEYDGADRGKRTRRAGGKLG